MQHVCDCDLIEFPLATLAENSRLNKAQGVVKAYMTIMSAYRGEVPCTVTTATVSNYKFGRATMHYFPTMTSL